jgi:hypothetical protein
MKGGETMAITGRVWRWFAVVTLILVGLPGSTAAQGEREAQVYVGNIAGLESIDAKFAAVVSVDNGQAVAFLASRDPAWNAANSKWFSGVASGGTLTARADDGTTLTGSVVGNRVEGTLGAGRWVGTLTERGVAGLYRARYGDEVHVAIVLPDGSWVGTAWSASTRQLLNTWNSGTGRLQQIGPYAVRLYPDPVSPPIELSMVLPWGGQYDAAWEQTPWSD